MLRFLSFRKKIFLSQLALFLLFTILLFPFVEMLVERIIRSTLKETTEQLVAKVEQAHSTKEMVAILERQELFAFFRVTLVDKSGNLIYDSHIEVHLHEQSEREVLRAFVEEEGYSEGYSTIFSREFAYVAESFYLNGREYILRTAFPLSSIEKISHSFEIGFLVLGVPVLFAFAALTWLIFSRTSRPINKLIAAVTPFQRGEREDLPTIDLGHVSDDEFGRLAQTFNALSKQVRDQIKTAITEKNEKQAILESLLEGVIAVDENQIVRYVNFTASKMLGLPKRQLLGRALSEVDKPEKKTYHRELLDKCKHLIKKSIESESVLTDAFSNETQTKLYLDLIAAPTAEHKGAILVIQDKSSHYKLLEMGKDFVANASHELRTPITIIKGFAETLEDLSDLSPEMLSSIVEKIVRNCQRMETLVKNLLTLADIENLPESRFHQTDLFDLIEKGKQILLSVYADAQVIIDSALDSLNIYADADLLELAIMNLLDNGAKYSRPPAQITIGLSVEEEEAKITISDRGIGIPKEDLEYIFERFYTVNKARSRRLGGAGLGLSIVKNIVEKHGGMISVASKVNFGTTFTIRLPLRPPYLSNM